MVYPETVLCVEIVLPVFVGLVLVLVEVEDFFYFEVTASGYLFQLVLVLEHPPASTL